MKRFLILIPLGLLAIMAQSIWGNLAFDHAIHEEAEIECSTCHPETPSGSNWEAPMPEREVCLDCHDDEDLALLSTEPASHQGNFRYRHQFDARSTEGDCKLCHLNQESCTICHHGENVDFLTHDRNWRYFHAITYYKRTVDCFSCHDPATSCQTCHEEVGALPWSHLQPGWSSPQFHGQQAKIDLSGCIQCHDGPDPVCQDCHGDL